MRSCTPLLKAEETYSALMPGAGLFAPIFTAWNPRTGKAVMVQAKTMVHFKPGKGMRARLNLRAVTSEQDAERLLQAS